MLQGCSIRTLCLLSLRCQRAVHYSDKSRFEREIPDCCWSTDIHIYIHDKYECKHAHIHLSGFLIHSQIHTHTSTYMHRESSTNTHTHTHTHTHTNMEPVLLLHIAIIRMWDHPLLPQRLQPAGATLYMWPGWEGAGLKDAPCQHVSACLTSQHILWHFIQFDCRK